jgi:hypothetical protein
VDFFLLLLSRLDVSIFTLAYLALQIASFSYSGSEKWTFNIGIEVLLGLEFWIRENEDCPGTTAGYRVALLLGSGIVLSLGREGSQKEK